MAPTLTGENDFGRPAEVTEHCEVVGDGVKFPKELTSEAAARGQGLSGYEELTPWETLMKFKLNSIVCLAATLSAATDGYQIGCAFPYSYYFCPFQCV
jgi:hypothetical protein